MRQLTFLGPGSPEWHEVVGPTLEGPKEALVRPIAFATESSSPAPITYRSSRSSGSAACSVPHVADGRFVLTNALSEAESRWSAPRRGG